MSIEIFFDTPGTYTIEDDGIRGNNISVVRDSFGVVVATFVHPADALTFTPNVPGVNFVINIADSLGSANVTFGDLLDPAQWPDSIVVKAMRSDGIVTLTANGSITEGGTDAAPDIIAAGIALRAEGGIGTPSNAIEIQTTFIEGFSAVGGINIANTGQIQIGGVTSALNGLSVNGGDIKLSAVGSIFLNDTDGAAMIQGASSSGSVTLTAIGALSDIYAVANAKVVLAPGGGITFNAGRDILIGPSGTNYDNDLLATGDIRLNAGGDVRLDGSSNIRTGAFGGVVGGDIFITAGHDINLEDTTGGLQTIESFNGDVIMTTGPGGTYRQNAVFTAAVQSTDNIFINADNVGLFSGGLSTSGLGQVVIRPVTPGLGIFLGTASDPFGAIGLSSDELDRIFSINLTVGSAETGRVEFVSPLMPGNVFNMIVESGTEIFMNASLALGGSLTLRAGDDLYISPLGDFTSSGGGFTAFVDDSQGDLGAGAVGNLDSVIAVSTTIRLNGNLDSDTLIGTAAGDILIGNGGNDFLNGRGGNDQLDGGIGADTAIGGLGDDTYFVDSLSDLVVEASGEGFDTVQTGLSYTLGAEVERLVMTGSAFVGTGNLLANTILGTGLANILDGGGGADQMRGGGGNDIYFVDNVGDAITELAGAGTDLVNSSVTFALAANVENLTLTGAGAIDGNGNALANALIGNNQANVLMGGGDIDTLTGNGGGDTLDGGTGADDMTGGLGNDTYVVDVAGDVVTEAAGAGTDTVRSSISYTLGATLENLTLIGVAAINGAGNNAVNTITGNGAANILNGAIGADTMAGGGGNDTYHVDNAGDVVTEAAAAGTDKVNAAITHVLAANVENLQLVGAAAINATGNNLVNDLTGNGAANTLNGAVGADIMRGAGGDDIYIVDNAGDVVVEAAGAGTDLVSALVNYTLSANVENLNLAGAAPASGTGNNLANAINGNGGGNVLKGEGGADILSGAGGADNLYGGAGNDDLNGGAGTDNFRFDTALSAATNVDDLLDFTIVDDTILLDRNVFTAIAADGTLAASAFRAGAAAGDADDRIIYNAATGGIFYDADGTGAAAQILFATVAAGTALTRLDFFAYTG